MTKQCPDCGAELTVTPDGTAVTWYEHPGGPCPKGEVITAYGERLNLEEFRALIRVARAQLELERLRGGR